MRHGGLKSPCPETCGFESRIRYHMKKEETPLTKEERAKVQRNYGASWKFSIVSKYEAALQALEAELAKSKGEA